MADLDTELHLLLVKKDYFEKNPSAGKLSIGPDDPIYIALKFSGDISALKQAGFTVGSTIGNIAYGVTNLAGLQALASHPQVEFIEKQRSPHTYLDDSIPDIKADQVWSRSGDNFTGYTGRGVIVGIIDTGIDFKHQVFRKADGTTRILKIWDQTINAPLNPPHPGETVPGPINNPSISPNPVPLGYGVEYTQGQINDTLTSDNPTILVRHVDDLWPRKESARSSRLPRCLIGRHWHAPSSRL
jgi:subtilisin family serine protease